MRAGRMTPSMLAIDAVRFASRLLSISRIRRSMGPSIAIEQAINGSEAKSGEEMQWPRVPREGATGRRQDELRSYWGNPLSTKWEVGTTLDGIVQTRCGECITYTNSMVTHTKPK